jgi:hypothetical protein
MCLAPTPCAPSKNSTNRTVAPRRPHFRRSGPVNASQSASAKWRDLAGQRNVDDLKSYRVRHARMAGSSPMAKFIPGNAPKRSEIYEWIAVRQAMTIARLSRSASSLSTICMKASSTGDRRRKRPADGPARHSDLEVERVPHLYALLRRPSWRPMRIDMAEAREVEYFETEAFTMLMRSCRLPSTS